MIGVINIQKHYGVAQTIVGEELAKDLVHHVYLKVADKLPTIEYPDTYFHRAMVNTAKRSKFTRDYTLIASAPLKASGREVEICWSSKQVKSLLIEMQQEGYQEEVTLFKLKVSGENMSDIAKRVGVNRTIIGKCVAFVKHSIKKRYADSYN